jgi:predicted DNA-binding transcriptional regulator AlpA
MQRSIGSPLQLQRRFVSEVELEQVTGISRRTWQKHRLLNRGPRYYKIHGSIRYELEEVLAWIRTLAVTREPTPTNPQGGAVA